MAEVDPSREAQPRVPASPSLCRLLPGVSSKPTLPVTLTKTRDEKLRGWKAGSPKLEANLPQGLLFCLFVFFLELPSLLKSTFFKNLKRLSVSLQKKTRDLSPVRMEHYI